jgi:TrmH family RNA methyltransferase
VKRIESRTNPTLKSIRRLAGGAHARRGETRFLLEGRKLVRAALESGCDVELVVFSSHLPPTEREGLAPETAELLEVDAALFRRLTSLDSSEGVLAVARRPSRKLDELRPEGLVLVSLGIQDPGNLGAVARVAEAAGASGLVVLEGSADPFGPKSVRGSMGSILRLPVYEAKDETVLETLGFRLAALVPKGGVDFRRADWTPPVAILLGREGHGLSSSVVERSQIRVSIPMRGSVESLNVAAAAALVAYEAARRPA